MQNEKQSEVDWESLCADITANQRKNLLMLLMPTLQVLRKSSELLSTLSEGDTEHEDIVAENQRELANLMGSLIDLHDLSTTEEALVQRLGLPAEEIH